MAVRISGVLKDGAGKPIQNCTIQLKARRNSTTVVVNTVASENPDEAGRYTMDVEYGQYSVSLLVEGFPPSHAGIITVYEDSKPGTLNDFLGAMTEDDARPEALRRFELMVEEVARNASAVEQNTAAAKKSASDAGTSAREAATHATDAAGSARAASTSAGQAATSAQSASSSAGTASTKATEASKSAAAAESSKSAAATSAGAAKTSETNAAASEQSAATSASTATTKASEAATSARDASASKEAAKSSETNASSSASSAASSATAAGNSAKAAKTSETNAKSSETAAGQSASAAAGSKTAAVSSASAASTSAGQASASATAAGKSAESAASSASTATTKAGEATEQASAAARSASAAKTSETNAKASETSAESSKTAAASSASSAASSASSASASKDEATRQASAARGSATTASTKATEAAGSAAAAAQSKSTAESAATRAETAAKRAEDIASAVALEDASTTKKGIVQLSSATNSTSETLAATPKAVKAAYDNAEKRLQKDQNGADIPDKDRFLSNINVYSKSEVQSALAGKQPLDNTLTNLSGKDVAGLLAYLGLRELGTSGEKIPLLSAANTWSARQTFNGGITGALTGNADTATKLKTAININGVRFDGSADININTLVSRGRVTALASNAQGTSGIQLYEAYNNGYPSPYGNVLHLKGTTAAGEGELFIGWSGTSGDHAPVHIRSRRDTDSANWSEWAQIYTSKDSVPGVNAKGNQDTSGNAATATKLQTARTINGVSFDGSKNIELTAADLNLEQTVELAAGALQKNQNGADIPGKDTFTKNIGACRAYSAWLNIGGDSQVWTTAQFISWLESQGAFNHPYWMCKGSWAYANNKVITDTGCGNICLAGAVVEVIGTRGAMTIRVTTPSTSSGGGITNAQFTYINHGDAYAPGWRRDYNTKNQQPAFALGQTGSRVANDKAVGWNWNSGVYDADISGASTLILHFNMNAGSCPAVQFRVNYKNGGIFYRSARDGYGFEANWSEFYTTTRKPSAGDVGAYTQAECNSRFITGIRLGGLSSVQTWNGPGWSDRSGYVVTGSVNGNRDELIDTTQARPIQYCINGTWYNAGSI
ncbi:TPA: prophage tail fiber N-terminal domain-containing protein [Escherichia coli]|nr:prophage tail fiber N-terminal domain-containing protein [Escherichia coli]